MFASMTSEARRKGSSELYIVPGKKKQKTPLVVDHLSLANQVILPKKEKQITKTPSERGEKYNPIIYLEEEPESF